MSQPAKPANLNIRVFTQSGPETDVGQTLSCRKLWYAQRKAGGSMSQVKRDLEEHEDLLMAIEALGIEEKALVHDEDTDEVSSAEDEQANKNFYARAFNEWAKGNI